MNIELDMGFYRVYSHALAWLLGMRAGRRWCEGRARVSVGVAVPENSLLSNCSDFRSAERGRRRRRRRTRLREDNARGNAAFAPRRSRGALEVSGEQRGGRSPVALQWQRSRASQSCRIRGHPGPSPRLKLGSSARGAGSAAGLGGRWEGMEGKGRGGRAQAEMQPSLAAANISSWHRHLAGPPGGARIAQPPSPPPPRVEKRGAWGPEKGRKLCPRPGCN